MQSVSDFLSAVKQRLHAPEGQMAVSDDTIIEFLNEELHDNVWPFLSSLRKNWNVTHEKIELGTSYPDNRIPLPRRAFAAGVRELKYSEVPGGTPDNLPEIAIEELDEWNTSSQSNRPIGFYIESDCIVLTGTSRQLSGDLHIWYIIEPSQVSTEIGRSSPITGAVDTAGSVEIALFPNVSFWNLHLKPQPNTPLRYDIFRMSTGSIVSIDLVGIYNNAIPPNLQTVTIQNDELFQKLESYQPGLNPSLPSYLPQDLVLTDAEYVNYVPVPKAADAWVVCLAAMRVLEAIGDIEGLSILSAQAEKSKQAMSKVLGVRNQGESKAFNSRRGIFGFIGFNSRYRR
jgi:hypothetical protein